MHDGFNVLTGFVIIAGWMCFLHIETNGNQKRNDSRLRTSGYQTTSWRYESTIFSNSTSKKEMPLAIVARRYFFAQASSGVHETFLIRFFDVDNGVQEMSIGCDVRSKQQHKCPHDALSEHNMLAGNQRAKKFSTERNDDGHPIDLDIWANSVVWHVDATT